MTTGAKFKLFLVILALILLGVILAALTTKRDLIKPFPKEADIKIIFSSPPPLPTADAVTPTEEEKPTPEPTAEKTVVEPTTNPISAPSEKQKAPAASASPIPTTTEESTTSPSPTSNE